MTTAVAVRERPIRFSGEMVRAILYGRKSQTRRVVKLTRDDQRAKLSDPKDGHGVLLERWEKTGRLFTDFGRAERLRCHYGQPGDRLWVRETFYIDLVPYDHGPLPKAWPEDLSLWRCERCGFETGNSEKIRNVVDGVNHLTCPRCMAVGEFVDAVTPMYYRADGECCEQIPECCCGEVGRVPWRPSIHMPRWASRITLDVTAIRVERLHDISEADAKAEGIIPDAEIDVAPGVSDGFEHRMAYARLWDSLNARRGYAWEVNPWVWVIEFKRISS